MNKVIKWSIYALVFLMPLMFLSFTAEILEFPKQMILVALTAAALIGWIGKMVTEKKLALRVSVLDLAVIIFLGIWGAAALLSQYPYGSLVGSGGSVADSFMSVLCFGVLYFVVVNNLDIERLGRKVKVKKPVWSKGYEVSDNDLTKLPNPNGHLDPNPTSSPLSLQGLLNIFLISAGVTLVLGILQMVGLKIFPWALAQARAFNTVGTLSSLGIFAGLILCVLALRGENRSLKAATSSEENEVATFTSRSDRGLKSATPVLKWVVALLAILTLIFINFWTLWLGMVLIMGFVLVLSIAFPKLFENKSLMLVMAVVLISLIFLFVRAPLINLNLPAEVSLTHKASLGIARETLREHPFLGSGPNTFGFDYSQWRSPQINNTIFWNIRFNQASSRFILLLATTGVLGVVGFLLMVVGFLWLVCRSGLNADLHADRRGRGFGILVPFLFLLLAIFLFPSNLTLTFFFFLFFALCAGVWVERRNLKITLAYSPRANQVLTFVSLVLILLIASGLWFEAKRVMAQVYFRGAISANIKGSPAEEVRILMVKAVNLETRNDLLWSNLSQALLLEIAEKINQQASSEEIQALIANTVAAARRATELASQDVANWQARGRVYLNLIGLVGGAEDWARDSYEKAISLEPNNPYLYTQLGIVYLTSADEEKTYEAIKQFEKAIELKGDYSPAHFQIALAYEKVGDLEKAIEKMESNKSYTPNDVGVRFQLGLMYYNKKDFELARPEFAEAIRLNPQFSNARYFLGLIYDREGKKDLAIGQFEAIERLNPDNVEVKTILNNLRAGRWAFGTERPEEVQGLPIGEEEPEKVPPSPGL